MSPRARDFTTHPEGLLPPLPDAIPSVAQASAEPLPLQPPQPLPFPPIALRSLRCGAYLINYTPSNSLFVSYDGTLRVECHSSGRTASGDLYQRQLILLPLLPGFPPIPRPPILSSAPNPAAGIPILPRSRYRYYLRVTQILEFFTVGKSFTLGFEMYRFNSTTRTWTNEGAFTALMTWTPAPAGYPSSNDYLTGEVKNGSGTVVGKLTMGWVSKYLRKATVEIDCVAGSEAPLDNGEGIDWKDIFEEVGWDATVDVSDPNVAPPTRTHGGWSRRNASGRRRSLFTAPRCTSWDMQWSCTTTRSTTAS
jgi:hypothetical protein